MPAPAPGGTGRRLSLGGILGVTVAHAEGLEIDLLGPAFGIHPDGPALHLPGAGRPRFRNGRGWQPGRRRW